MCLIFKTKQKNNKFVFPQAENIIIKETDFWINAQYFDPILSLKVAHIWIVKVTNSLYAHFCQKFTVGSKLDRML